MDNAANFYKAARPDLPRCVGLQMRPYSLGHHITLRRFDISFLKGEPRYADLILGSFICSQTWNGWHEWLNSWKFKWLLRAWGWLQRKCNVRREAEIFAEYILQGSKAPEVAIPSKSDALCSPWEIRLKLFLMREFRLNAEQAMDYPLALAWQEYCASLESEGKITLLSESDEAALSAVGSDRISELVAKAKADHAAEVEEMKSRAAGQPQEEN